MTELRRAKVDAKIRELVAQARDASDPANRKAIERLHGLGLELRRSELPRENPRAPGRKQWRTVRKEYDILTELLRHDDTGMTSRELGLALMEKHGGSAWGYLESRTREMEKEGYIAREGKGKPFWITEKGKEYLEELSKMGYSPQD